MDADRFDDLAKAVVGGISRRRLLTGVVGVVAGAGLGRPGRAQEVRPREACAAKGGWIVFEDGVCNAGGPAGDDGLVCGPFESYWITWCNTGGWNGLELIAKGCRPCLWR